MKITFKPNRKEIKEVQDYLKWYDVFFMEDSYEIEEQKAREIDQLLLNHGIEGYKSLFYLLFLFSQFTLDKEQGGSATNEDIVLFQLQERIKKGERKIKSVIIETGKETIVFSSNLLRNFFSEAILRAQGAPEEWIIDLLAETQKKQRGAPKKAETELRNGLTEKLMKYFREYSILANIESRYDLITEFYLLSGLIPTEITKPRNLVRTEHQLKKRNQ